NTDLADTVHACLQRRTRAGLQRTVRLPDQRSRGPRVVGGNRHEHQRGQGADAARVSIEPVEHERESTTLHYPQGILWPSPPPQLQRFRKLTRRSRLSSSARDRTTRALLRATPPPRCRRPSC